MEYDGNSSLSPDNIATITTPSKIMSDYVNFIFLATFFVVLCGVFSLAGMAANVINLAVFIKQGLWADSVTISLAGMAFADFGSLITMLWHSICQSIISWPPPYHHHHLPFDPLGVKYVTAGYPHVMFTRITCWITAYVAFERCLCVLLPFKVKQLFTATRSTIVILCIYVTIIAFFVPIYYTHRLQKMPDVQTNATILRLVLSSDWGRVEKVCHTIIDIILPTLSLTIVTVCTRFTISHLNATTKWRKKNASSGTTSTTPINVTSADPSAITNSNARGKDAAFHYKPKKGKEIKTKPSSTAETNMSTKERKTIKMITAICIVLIICYTPSFLTIFVRFAVPEFANLGRYDNLYHAVYSVCFFLQCVNSSVNIIFYYLMSSRYKQEFNRLFGIKSQIDKE